MLHAIATAIREGESAAEADTTWWDKDAKGDVAGPHRIKSELRLEAIRLMLEVLEPTGRIRLLPSSFWKALDPDLLILFAITAARWTIVTTELIEWLRDEIAGRKAIEIGAGAGDLGSHLGILQTDSFSHCETPEVLARARRLHHAVPLPPPQVRRLDGLMAVRALRPEVVVGSWITEYGLVPRPGVTDNTSSFGVRETALVHEAAYILVGHVGTHGTKRILDFPHEEHRPSWLVSRAVDPTGDRIWTWKRQQRRKV